MALEKSTIELIVREIDDEANKFVTNVQNKFDFALELVRRLGGKDDRETSQTIQSEIARLLQEKKNDLVNEIAALLKENKNDLTAKRKEVSNNEQQERITPVTRSDVAARIADTINDNDSIFNDSADSNRTIESNVREVESQTQNDDDTWMEDNTDNGYTSSEEPNEADIESLLTWSTFEPSQRNQAESSTCDDGTDKDVRVFDNLEWLRTVQPKKLPYFPQLGDEVVYIQQCHKAFFHYIRYIKLYEIDEFDMSYCLKFDFKAHEFARVKDISFKRKQQMRICHLKLERIREDGEKTDEYFEVDYHCIKDHPYNFLVLRQHFDSTKNWQIGSRFRQMVGDTWRFGKILSKQALDPQQFPDSKYKCLRVQADNGSKYSISPWDIEPTENDNIDESAVVSLDYQPALDEWNQLDRPAVCFRILQDWDRVMKNYSEWLDDLSNNSLCAHEQNDYPIDYKIIRSRMENLFYRHIDALKFDLKYFIDNFGAKIHTNIGRELLESVEKIINTPIAVIDISLDDEHTIQNIQKNEECSESSLVTPSQSIITLPRCCTTDTQFSRDNSTSEEVNSNEENEENDDSDEWSSENNLTDEERSSIENDLTDEENENELNEKSKKSCSCMNSDNYKNYWLIWQTLIEDNDSEPFREPVCEIEFPDYRKNITSAMDLHIVQEQLVVRNYSNPKNFASDIRLIFENSKAYNTDQDSKIYHMTLRLSNKFEKLMDRYFPKYSNKIKKSDSPRKRRQDSNSSIDISYNGSDSKKMRSNNVSDN